ADTTNSVGATGGVAIHNGTFSISSNLWIGSPFVSTGQVFVAGGSLIVTNSVTNSVLGVSSGGLVLSGGSLFTDSVRLTNTQGQFTFSGGTLHTKKTTLANGAPVVVGEGDSPAPLHLKSGKHFFSAGRVFFLHPTLPRGRVVF